MTVESIILDIDGTLWDSRALVSEGYNLQLRAEGLEALCTTPEQLTKVFGLELEALADQLYPVIPVPERYALARRCMEREALLLQEDPCQIAFPGVVNTLKELAKTHRLFIVSNSQRGYPQLCVEKLGLTHLICDTLCYGETGRPKGENIRLIMERNGVQSAVYVGDTQSDLDACRVAGIPFLFAAYGFGHPDSWDGKIDSFPQLLEILK